jgi:geranylgeranyl pyrophosphate synthase
LASVSASLTAERPEEAADSGGRKSRRRKTAHLKAVPPMKSLREELRARCAAVAAKLDKSRPLTKDEMEHLSRQILTAAGLPEAYVGWMMVVLASEFWRDQVAAVPHSRRLFLLPHCLKHAQGCPADYDEFGLACKQCGACSIADFRGEADALGYKVLVAEGSPIVLKIIVSGHVDAIVGVACLNVLEKAIDKILLAGIPCMAVPLLSSDCRDTSVDEDWVAEMVKLRHEQPQQQSRTYVHLMRSAASLFEPAELERIAPRLRGGPPLAEMNGQGVHGLDAIAATEAITYDFLARGGKHSRPFITLAVHDALSGGHGTLAGGAQHLAALPDAVRRAALSIETFHKASLVHDDIEDDDQFRYGDETLHRKYGVPSAINIGDFMIGLGYRLVSRDAKSLGPECVAEILDTLADAHMKLSEGQGAELLWRDGPNKRLKPLDALKIYALKTSPAFEAALVTGARLAGDVSAYREPMKQFARHVGVAFQILNDLKDWRGDDNNKLAAGGDVLGGRPTLLWALALEGLSPAEQQELETIICDVRKPADLRIQRVRQLYHQASVFEKAERLVDKYQDRAEEIADQVQPEELRRLFYYLIDTVLERGPDAPTPVILSPEIVELPVIARPM